LEIPLLKRREKMRRSVSELRVASQCTPVTEMRGSAPTAQCLTQWGTPEPTTTKPTTTEAPTKAAAAATAAPAAKQAEVKPLVIQESFAAAMAFLALALHA
jgi:hypothetical protein